MTKQELLFQTFKNKFDLARFKKFIVEFFNDAKLLNDEKLQDRWNWNEYAFYINGYYHVADYVDDKHNKIAIFAVELQKGRSPEKARGKQRNFIADRLKATNYDGAIAAFYSEDEKENRWRLSFVRLDYEFVKGKIGEKLTPAKRYSYLLGVDEPCHTAMQQLYPILEEERFNPSIEKLEEAFSVERVTKQFFEKYKEKYFELYEYLNANATFVDEASRCINSEREEDISKFTEQFAKKLMGQIVFMYFLQKKGWLGVNAFPPKIRETEYKNAFFGCNAEHKEIMKTLYVADDDGNYVRQGKAIHALSQSEQVYFAARIKGMPWETGPKNFVRILFNEAVKNGKNYFDDYLEPLFYEALNEKREADNYYARLHCRIPFLNGGLFEPLDGYDWENNNFSIPNEIFSNVATKGEREADGILDIFDRYNFTMNEDEPLEKEVAVDPEMLGKIFENLLDVKDRKSKGAFYTPREIVHYMCQESLINYLVNTVGTPYEDTKDFILYGEIMKDEDCSREVKQGYAEMLMPESIYKNLKAIDDALADVRVADPAVGSGAFPMGMVNEIVKARENITAYFARSLSSGQQHQLWNVTRHPYILKRDAMKNSIFAVDIEPSAVDITKLRLWLSLVVEFDVNSDNDEFKNPPTLPNLECNILCGNSLIDEFEGVILFHGSTKTGAGDDASWTADLFQDQVERMLDRLIEKQRELFYANNHADKYRLKHEIDVLQQQVIWAEQVMTNEVKERFIATFSMPSKPYILWKLAFAKVFREKGGFDIVIGNPPYLAYKKIDMATKDIYNRLYPCSSGQYDLYGVFFERGYQLLKKGGFLTYISSSTYFNNKDFAKLRKHLLEDTLIAMIVNLDETIFETAQLDVAILGFTKNRFSPESDHTIRISADKQAFLTNSYELRMQKEFINPKLSYEIKLKCSSMDEALIQKMKQGSKLLDEILDLPRGIEIGGNSPLIAASPEEGYEKLLVGRNLKRYQILYNHLYIKYDATDISCFKEYAIYNQPKILIQRIRNLSLKERIVATIDTENYLCTNTLRIGNLKNKDYDLYYILGILNSSLVNWMFLKYFLNKDIYSYQLKQIPVKEPTQEQKAVLSDMVHKMIALKSEGVEEDARSLDERINSYVYALYGLTLEEIALVENTVK